MLTKREREQCFWKIEPGYIHPMMVGTNDTQDGQSLRAPCFHPSKNLDFSTKRKKK